MNYVRKKKLLPSEILLNKWLNWLPWAYKWKKLLFFILDIPVSHKLQTHALLSGFLPYKPVSHFNPCPRILNRDTFLMTTFLLRAIFKYSGKTNGARASETGLSGKPVVISHRLFLQEQGSWPCASLQTVWCLNLRSMRNIDIPYLSDIIPGN